MQALLTSCGRPDLLMQTLNSFYEGNKYQIEMSIHEDAKEYGYDKQSLICAFPGLNHVSTMGAGQHKSIELFLMMNRKHRYYIHLEDDWQFNNHYDWISESIKIMERDDNVIKVLARDGSPHPCDHHFKYDPESVSYGYLNPWTGADGIEWCGFSWNPGVTRLDVLSQYLPFPKWEQDLAQRIHDDGLKVVSLSKPVYTHIGDGRSTH